MSSLPPKRKTFFLIRHGESKWNEAQSKINIAGMLDRDHPLTDLGISQAQSLNERWRRHFAEASRAPVTVLSNVAKAIASQPASAATAGNRAALNIINFILTSFCSYLRGGRFAGPLKL